MSSDAKWVVGVGAIVIAILGSAWIVSHVMITLAGMVRTDLHDLRESLERAACGEFARASPDPQRLPAGPSADGAGNVEAGPPVPACSGR